MGKDRLSYNAQLAEIYAKIPSIECKGLCQESCGIIPVHRPELKRIRKKTDVDLDAHTVKLDGITAIFNSTTDTCPLLVDGRCSVYDVRPFICRVFGVVEGMTCRHGCKPERYLSRDEVGQMVGQLKKLG